MNMTGNVLETIGSNSSFNATRSKEILSGEGIIEPDLLKIFNSLFEKILAEFKYEHGEQFMKELCLSDDFSFWAV